MNLLFLLLPLLSLIWPALSGKVRPFGANSIILSSTNAGELADYNFTMTLDTDLPSPGLISIIFPLNQYVAGLGLPNTFKVYAPYPNLITATLDATSSTTATTIVCEVGARTANESFTIEIRDIRNPLKTGGTGNFKIISYSGTKVIDINNNFGVIGIFAQSVTLLSASIDFEPGMSEQAGQLTSYVLSFVPSVNLPALIDIKVIFPTVYDFSYIQSTQCGEYGSTLGLSLKCQKNSLLKNVIIFTGFSSAIAQGTTVKLLFQNVSNPSYEMTTEALSFWVREVGTNNTIQQAEGVPGLYIAPGPMFEVSLANAYPSFPLYTTLDRELILSFRPSNPFNVIKIGTPFPIVRKCTVINGLSLIGQTVPIICSASSGVMVIKGLKTYNPRDLYLNVVQIKFHATMPTSNIKTNQIEIYTFLDESYASKVDQDTSTDATQIQIVTLTTTTSLAATTTLTTTSTTIGATNQLSFRISPAASYTGVSKVVFEFSREFSGIPSCQFMPAGGTLGPKTCTFSNGLLTVIINANINMPGGGSRARIVIDGLKNPSIPKTYTIPYFIYSAAGAVIEYFYSLSFTVAPQTISTISMLPLSDAASLKTFYILKFVTPVFLQDGYVLLAEPGKLSSYIDIVFNMYTTANSFTADLGSALADRSDYPCEIIGMKASVYTTHAKCVLIAGPATVVATSTVTIRVLDFNPVLQGTLITINIPLVNTQLAGPTNPQATVNTYTVKGYQTYLTSSASLTALTPTSSTTGATPALTVSLTNSSVQAETSIQFSFTSVALTASNNASILIQYPAGYTFSPSSITVNLDGVDVDPEKLHFAEEFRFFTIELATSVSASTRTIIVDNIKTPNASRTSSYNFIVKTIQSNVIQQTATFSTQILTPGAFDADAIMGIFPDEPNHPYGAYQFNFSTTKYIKTGSTITVVFPTDYTLDSYVECSKMLGLTDNASAGALTCTIDIPNRKATISNFDTIEINTAIELEIFGVTNPSTTAAMSFVVSVLDSSSNIIETLTFSSSLTGTAFSPLLDLNVGVIQLLPSNPVVAASFQMTMDPGFQLPKKSLLSITFHNDFNSLYSSTISEIECAAEGGLYTLTQCTATTASPFVVTMEIGATSNASVPIDFYYFGYVSYPTANNLITGFTATLKYKGVDIATAATLPTVTSSDSWTPSTGITMDFYPRNEGEQANYYFTIDVTAVTTITKDMSFLIRFPLQYDPALFLYEPVAESSQLFGALHTKVVQRQIIITGFAELEVTEPITIRLWGIVNPNKIDITRTGSFAFALLDANGEIVEGNFAISGIVPLLAPESIQLSSVTASTTTARHTADFTFNFQSTKNIIAAQLGGQIFVDFPPDYIIDSYGGQCDINEEFSFFVNCQIDNNRIFINSSNPLWTPTMSALTFVAQDIRTPDDNGPSMNFIISNYDSVGKRIVSRTYSTLNPASITYTYDGDLISINDDEPVDVEVGTYTDEIVLRLPGPAQQTLTLTPNTLNSTILITPFPLQIQLGESMTTFRVAVPRDILLKNFYITWSKTGDSLTPTYANLRRTKLRMKSGWVQRLVSFESMEYIPVGGITFPLLVMTPNPPYDELILTMTVQNGDTLTYLSKAKLNFAKGNFNQNYTITVAMSHPTTTAEILFTISGYDGPSYYMEDDTLIIPIEPRESVDPEIISSTVVSTTRSTATFDFETNRLSFIYYMIAYQNVPVPTFADVSAKAFNETLNYSVPIFGENYIKRTPKNITFTVTGLEPGIDYQIYAYVMNLNQDYSELYAVHSFSTKPPQKIAEFVMEIRQTLLPTDLKSEIRSRLSQMISIETSRLIERTSNCVQTADSILFNAANYSYFHLYVLPDPTNENDSSEPLQLVRNLNTRTDEIRQFVPRLADGELSQIKYAADDIPTFGIPPAFELSDYYSLKITISLKYCGYIHAIAIPVALSQNDTATKLTTYQHQTASTPFPSSFEISNGLDIQNQPAIYSTLRVADTSNEYSFSIDGLVDNLIYNIYITTENDWPMYNKLLDSDNVARVNAKTIKKKKPLDVYSVNFDSKDAGLGAPLASQVSWGALLILFIVSVSTI